MRRTLPLLLVAACGSHPPAQRDLPSLSDNPPAPPPSEPAPPPTDDKGGGLTPELVAAVAGRAMVIEDFTSLKLNAAERRKAQHIVASWAKASGLNILPPDQVEDAIARAARGQDPNGKACGPEIDRDYAMERWILPMGAKGKITPHVWCKDTCMLQLEIHLNGLGTEFFAAPFDPSQPWEVELARRLPQVRDNGGHERYGHANNPTNVTGVPRKQGASDWLLDDTGYLERPLDGETALCGIAAMPVALLLEPDPKGGVRCERAATGVYVTDYSEKVNACMCAIATKREKVTARTYVMYPSMQRVDRPKTKSGKDISAKVIGGNEYRPEGSAPWFFRDSDSIEHCFTGRTEDVEPVEINATLEFDRNGAIAKATLGDISGIFRPDERACITTKLMTIRSPCPPTPPLVGTARVTLHIHKPYGEK